MKERARRFEGNSRVRVPAGRGFPTQRQPEPRRGSAHPKSLREPGAATGDLRPLGRVPGPAWPGPLEPGAVPPDGSGRPMAPGGRASGRSGAAVTPEPRMRTLASLMCICVFIWEPVSSTLNLVPNLRSLSYWKQRLSDLYFFMPRNIKKTTSLKTHNPKTLVYFPSSALFLENEQ